MAAVLRGAGQAAPAPVWRTECRVDTVVRGRQNDKRTGSPGMFDVFVNYRHDDRHAAARLADRLPKEFSAFFDVGIGFGKDIEKEILPALGEARVVLAVVGEKWVSPQNLKRLRAKDDWIFRELTLTLARPDVTLIPVLVDDHIDMPSKDMLPEALHPFVLRKAVRLHDDSWNEDLDDFIETIRSLLPARTAARTQTQSKLMPRDAPFLCDRVPQEDDFTGLALSAQATRSLVCVLPGHKWEAHLGFIRRLQQKRRLEDLFGASSAGVDVHLLEWNIDYALDGKHAELLRSAIKRTAMKSARASDDELAAFLRNTGRPVVLVMQVTWSDVQECGATLLTSLEAAWNAMIAQLGSAPANALILCINLTYEDAKQEVDTQGLKRLAKLRPVRESDISNWVNSEEMQRFTQGYEIKLSEIAKDPRYCIAPGQLHMQRFVDAVRELIPTE